ncbi:MAG: LOG family protein [Verrucomicrobia bacterium]|nr:LOG family protein [Verrucomicrobiota bacterium]
MKKLISIFGGSQCGPDDVEYRDALALGRLLAARGFTVVCGGYSGVMEAVSRGAREAGGEVIGITLAFRQKPGNPFLSRAEPAANLFDRLRGLIEQSSGYVALRGGMGTVVEVTLVWNHFLLKLLPPRPLVLLGDCWPPVVESWKQHLVVEERELRWVRFAPTPEDAVAHIQSAA